MKRVISLLTLNENIFFIFFSLISLQGNLKKYIKIELCIFISVHFILFILCQYLNINLHCVRQSGRRIYGIYRKLGKLNKITKKLVSSRCLKHFIKLS